MSRLQIGSKAFGIFVTPFLIYNLLKAKNLGTSSHNLLTSPKLARKPKKGPAKTTVLSKRDHISFHVCSVEGNPDFKTSGFYDLVQLLHDFQLWRMGPPSHLVHALAKEVPSNQG